MKFASIALGMSVLIAPSSGLLRASIRKQEIRMAQDAQMQPAEKQKLELQANMSNEAHTSALLREQLKSELVAADDGSIVRMDDATVLRADDSAVESKELLREELKDKFLAEHQRLHPQNVTKDSWTEAAEEAQADANEAHADELLDKRLQQPLMEANATEASAQRDDALSPQEQRRKRLAEEQTRQLFEEAVPMNPASQAPSQERTRLWSGLSTATRVSKQVQKHMEAEYAAFDQPRGAVVTRRARRSLSSNM